MIIPTRKHETILWDRLQDETIVLEQDAKLLLVLVLTQGEVEKRKIQIDLKGNGAECDVVGFIKGTGAEEFNFSTLTKHIGSSTRGHIYFKGILYDQSKTNYEGMMRIEKSGKLADAHMTHHSLLLSPDARARSIPALEIEADDVKAGHAATVGQVDEESLFYLRSRGLSEEEARNLLVEGFFEEGLVRIPDEAMRRKIREQLF